MPELPEVETVRRGLEPAMAGNVLSKIDVRRKDLRVPFPPGLAKLLEGRTVLRLTRRAKYLLIHVDGKCEDILIVHLGMSGQMTVVQDIKNYKPKKHDHMILSMSNGVGVVFNDARRFGMVMLTTPLEMDAHAAFCLLGPEPLSNSFNGEILHERLRGKSTPIKLAILDQRVVAGIGNIYASEALYEASISPLRQAGSLSLKNCEDLAAAIKNVLTYAIAAGGSSLKDYRRADGELGYFQHSFIVYDREGEACPRCMAGGKKKAIIRKIVQSGRSTYDCPSCQK